MLWFYILAIIALHIMFFIYIKTLITYIESHHLTLKDWQFSFWLVLFIELIGVSLLMMNIKPIDIYSQAHMAGVIALLFFITIALIAFSYFGKKYRFIIKLSAMSAVAVLNLYVLISSDIFTSLFEVLFS